jgi:hypothetical protein
MWRRKDKNIKNVSFDFAYWLPETPANATGSR